MHLFEEHPYGISRNISNRYASIPSGMGGVLQKALALFTICDIGTTKNIKKVIVLPSPAPHAVNFILYKSDRKENIGTL
jgi:hypothetical protein